MTTNSTTDTRERHNEGSDSVEEKGSQEQNREREVVNGGSSHLDASSSHVRTADRMPFHRHTIISIAILPSPLVRSTEPPWRQCWIGWAGWVDNGCPTYSTVRCTQSSAMHQRQSSEPSKPCSRQSTVRPPQHQRNVVSTCLSRKDPLRIPNGS